MLIHVTRFVDVQNELRALVRAEMQALSSTLKMEGRASAALMKELKEHLGGGLRSDVADDCRRVE